MRTPEGIVFRDLTMTEIADVTTVLFLLGVAGVIVWWMLRGV